MDQEAPPKDIFQDTVETLELAVRSARRCAYDLKHCADALTYHEGKTGSVFSWRADHYVRLFQSGNSVKDYRHRLHEEIERRDSQISALKDLLKSHGIEVPPDF